MLALGLDDAISKMRIPDRDFNMLGRVPEAPSLKISEIDFAPNPIFETNSQLAELTAIVTRLVDVAKQQAELTQSIRKTSDLTLTYAVQSGEEAKTATQLARTS